MKTKTGIQHLSPYHREPTRQDVERLAPLIGLFLSIDGTPRGDVAIALPKNSTRDVDFSAMGSPRDVIETDKALASHSMIGRMGASFISLGDPGVGFETHFPSVDLSKVAGWGIASSVDGATPLTLGKPNRVAGQVIASTLLFKQAPLMAALLLERQIHAAIAGAIDLAAFHGSGTSPEPLGLTLNSEVNSTDGPVTLSLIAAAEKAIAAGYCETMPVGLIAAGDVRETLRTSFVNGTGSASIWDSLNDIEKSSSPHLASGTTVIGDWSQMLVCQWGMLNLSVNPYHFETTSKVKVIVETFADVIPLRPGAFEVIQPAA